MFVEYRTTRSCHTLQYRCSVQENPSNWLVLPRKILCVLYVHIFSGDTRLWWLVSRVDKKGGVVLGWRLGVPVAVLFFSPCSSSTLSYRVICLRYCWVRDWRLVVISDIEPRYRTSIILVRVYTISTVNRVHQYVEFYKNCLLSLGTRFSKKNHGGGGCHRMEGTRKYVR